MNKKKLLAYAALVFSMIFWGLSFIGSKMVFEYLSPVATIFFRLIIASVFLILLSLMLGKLQKPKRRDLPWFFALTFFEPFLYFLGEGYGLLYTAHTTASIIVSTIPLFVPFSMYILAKEKINQGTYFGILVSFVGVILVVLKGDFSFASEPKGILFLMVAVFSVMGYSYILQRLSKTYNAFTIISTQNTIGIFYFLPLFLLFDAQNMPSVQWDAGLLIPLVILGIFCSAVAFYLFTVGIQYIGVTKATIFTYVIPVITAIASYFIMQEFFSTRKIIGVGVTIAGLLISQIKWQGLLQRFRA